MKEEVSMVLITLNGSINVEIFKKTILLDLKVNGEFYVSMAYKPMIKDGLKIKTFLIDYFMQWGTFRFRGFNWYAGVFKK